MRRALVATVRNEEARLPEFLASLERQTVRPDVIVVTDGGSTDHTPELLRTFASQTPVPFRWAPAPGNRSRGRNEAIRLADADVIAVTDVSVLDPSWFGRIVAPIEAGTADLVSGWYELRVESLRERTIGLLTQYSLDQVREDTFLPSSRSVAFRRDLWERAGGYPEAFSGNEDTIFDLAAERLRPGKVFVKAAIVRWRPAPSARAVYRQYKRYAEGDGQAAIFLTTGTRYAALYAAYGLGIALLLLLGAFWPPLELLLVLLVLGYVGFRIRKIVRARLWLQIPYAVLVVLAWDWGRIIGYTKGRWDRLRHGGERYRYGPSKDA